MQAWTCQSSRAKTAAGGNASRRYDRSCPLSASPRGMKVGVVVSLFFNDLQAHFERNRDPRRSPTGVRASSDAGRSEPGRTLRCGQVDDSPIRAAGGPSLRLLSIPVRRVKMAVPEGVAWIGLDWAHERHEIRLPAVGGGAERIAHRGAEGGSAARLGGRTARVFPKGGSLWGWSNRVGR